MVYGIVEYWSMEHCEARVSVRFAKLTGAPDPSSDRVDDALDCFSSGFDDRLDETGQIVEKADEEVAELGRRDDHIFKGDARCDLRRLELDWEWFDVRSFIPTMLVELRSKESMGLCRAAKGPSLDA